MSAEVRTRTLFGVGSVEALPDVLRGYRARRLLLVTGASSFETCGAKPHTERLEDEFTVDRFAGFSPNPRLDEARPAIEQFRRGAYDAVVGVGGGTAMDMAKLVAVLGSQAREPEAYVQEEHPLAARACRLVLVPTTAGSGSEATSFAVVYIGRRKHSLDGPQVRADCAIVDPALTATMPRALTASTGLDVLSQAVEAYWSVRSTSEARAYAMGAARLVLDHLEAACERPTPLSREMMSLAALFAGHAIDVSRTTAPHAMAYPLTMWFGVPHGHACVLTLPEFLVFNAGVKDDDVTDQRGAGFVRQRIDEVLRLLGASDPVGGADRIRRLVRNTGLATRLSQLGVRIEAAAAALADGVNAQRMANNPRCVSPADVGGVLRRIG